MTFLKNHPRPCATLKQVFLDRFELVVARLGPPKIPKCLENGLFWDQQWVKNGSKTHFSKRHRRLLLLAAAAAPLGQAPPPHPKQGSPLPLPRGQATLISAGSNTSIAPEVATR